MTLRRSLFSLLLSSLALTGCISGAEGSPDNLSPNEGPIAFPEGNLLADGGTDAGTYEVRGTRVMHYRTDLGDFTQAIDPFNPELKAFTYQDGGTRALTVQTGSDGAFVIPDAPSGRYYLQLGTFYVVSDSRSLNLDRYDLGRRDWVSAASSSVSVTVSAGGLEPQPYTDYPYFEAVSSNLGTVASMSAKAPMDAGTTSIDKLPVTYTMVATPELRLVNASRGDRLYVNQFATHDNGAFSYDTIDRSFAPGPVTMGTDAGTDLQGTFQPAAQYTVGFEWWRSRFEAYQIQVHPQSTPSYQSFSISPSPWSSDSWYGYSGDLLNAYLDGNAITDLSTSVTYGNPYPFSWGAVATVTHTYQTPTRLPGTTSGGITGRLSDTRPLKALASAPFAPRITPPWDVAVDGRNAQQEHTLTSLTPRITWKAPLVGTPSGYRIGISRVYLSSTTRTSAVSAGSFHTRETSLDVPPGVIQLGQKYVITVYAYYTPGFDYAVNPYGLEGLADAASAGAVSSILTAPATSPFAPQSPEFEPEQPFVPEPGIRPTRLDVLGPRSTSRH